MHERSETTKDEGGKNNKEADRRRGDRNTDKKSRGSNARQNSIKKAGEERLEQAWKSVFMNKKSEIENQPLYDRFVTAEGMHAVPPPMTGNYMPSGPDVEVDDSKMSTKVKTPRETIKNHFTHSQKPKVDKKELGYGFTVRACFVCGSLNHLIRDCDFHEKRMERKAELNYGRNNVQRVNKQNQFVPSAVLIRIGKIPVNTARTSGTKNVSTARQSFNRQAVLTSTAMKVNTVKPIVNRDYPHRALKNKGIVDSGCSRHMTGNKAYLAEFQDFNGGPVAFEGSKGYITSKGKIKTGKLDFEDVCFTKELQHFNLFSVSQMCDKKNKVLFTDSECLVLSPEFKLLDENQVLLKIPRQNNMYSFNLENIVPSGGLACLIAKATTDESNKWHRRLGHVNFKNLNKLVKGNLVRGLPSKIFQNDHTCVACQKGKQHKASCKAKSVSSISHSLQLLHMDLFGPTSVRSLNHKTYCLVITDDFSRFSWVFFLRTKDETSGILKDFIRQIENQLNQKVKTIRCDNGTEFKNKDVIEFCGSKGIKREYSNARTPQQNGVAERKNRTLIEAARTMLADSFLPNTFWAEAVSTACYVLNRVLVTKPHNKTPYELLTGPKEANPSVGTEDNIDAGNSEIEAESTQDYFILPIWSSYTSTVKSSKAKNAAEALRKEFAQDTKDLLLQEGAAKASNDSEIPALEEIYNNPTDGIFTNASYDDEGAVADFTNLETIVNTDPSPRPSTTTHILDSIPEGSGGNHGGQSSSDRSLSGNEGGMTLQSVYDLCISLCTQVTDQAKEIKHLKAQIKKLKKKAKHVNTHHKAWIKSGRKPAKDEPTVHKDPTFDELADDTLDYMETEDAQYVRRISYVVYEEEESAEKVSTEDALKIRTRRSSKNKKRSRVLKDVEETERPRPTSTKSLLTLKPLPKIDPKDKGKKRIEEDDESDTESEGITKAEKKLSQLVGRRGGQKGMTNADKILAEKLQEEEREMYTIEQRAKLLHDTIDAQIIFLTQQRSEAIRTKPPSRNQLRN
ncbi:putative ribonuclease H-like domain-containing protein [Tanacetum coccineum]